MSVRLALAEWYVPAPLKRRRLAGLLRLSADAFGAPAPDLRRERHGACLQTFAGFTAAQAARIAADGVAAGAIRSRLRAGARAMGLDLARVLGVRTRAEGLRAARLVYRLLGIDFTADVSGSVVMRECAFSRVYSPVACALMSALDEGLLAGLAGEGRLEFTARLTEGCACCEATFHFADERP